MTGLSLTLKSVDAVGVPCGRTSRSNGGGAEPAGSDRNNGGAAAGRHARAHATPSACLSRGCESALPVLVGREPIAFVQAGRILLHPLDRPDLSRLTRRLLKWDVRLTEPEEDEKGAGLRVLSAAQFESILGLIGAFARYLGASSRGLAAREAGAASPQIEQARAFIEEHQAEDISLSRVARAVNMSAFYFCKMFKQSTGLNFTDYLARIRVEKVKNLLHDPRRRVSEAAFRAGFQSLSQFNRVFRKVAGEAPSTYRARARRTSR